MIELRYFKASDFRQLIEWVKSPAFLLQWAGPTFHYPLDEQQLENYLKDANYAGSSSLIYSVVEQETRDVIGHISLRNIDRKNNTARIEKVLVGDGNVRGKGIGQQMIKEIVRIGFEELQLHRISLGVFDFNTPAIACYEKAGFKKEGLLRDARKFEDGYWSLWEMSMLADEFK